MNETPAEELLSNGQLHAWEYCDVYRRIKGIYYDSSGKVIAVSAVSPSRSAQAGREKNGKSRYLGIVTKTRPVSE